MATSAYFTRKHLRGLIVIGVFNSLVGFSTKERHDFLPIIINAVFLR